MAQHNVGAGWGVTGQQPLPVERLVHTAQHGPECRHCHCHRAEELANASPLGSAGRAELSGLYLEN